MRYRGVQIGLWAKGLCHQTCRSAHVRHYSAQQGPGPATSSRPSAPGPKTTAQVVKEHTASALQYAGELGHQWGQRSVQAATASLNFWWGKYEEFVGINEVREAQNKVTEAEAAFMVARGMNREAQASLDALQVRLREVRDRLDRISREEAQYMELIMVVHKLLQEERRLRTAQESAATSEREKFSQFSTAIRESHEKERLRAERIKNWSVMGSVLGALIGLMGSTYLNRLWRQELKNLLLEAQKGPQNLQEALEVQAKNHRSQQDELRLLIDSLRGALSETSHTSSPAPRRDGDQRPESVPVSLLPQLGQLSEGLGRVEGQLSSLRGLLETDTQTPAAPLKESVLQSMEDQGPKRHGGPESVIQSMEECNRRNRIYNAVFSYTAAAISVSAIYLLLRGAT